MEGFQMSKTMRVEEALGTLIAAANPYIRGSEAIAGTGMHLVRPKGFGTGIPAAENVTLAEIQVEEDSKYPAEWTFKGQSQKIHKALRIQYCYPKKGHAGQTYMVTDYLLIGFEGSGGGE
jgi:hypothetical protein